MGICFQSGFVPCSLVRVQYHGLPVESSRWPGNKKEVHFYVLEVVCCCFDLTSVICSCMFRSCCTNKIFQHLLHVVVGCNSTSRTVYFSSSLPIVIPNINYMSFVFITTNKIFQHLLQVVVGCNSTSRTVHFSSCLPIVVHNTNYMYMSFVFIATHKSYFPLALC